MVEGCSQADAAARAAVFRTSTDYHELNAGAHRKAPKVLSAPALVRHLAFWICPEPGCHSIRHQNLDDIKNAIDSLIVALFRKLRDVDAKAKLAGETDGLVLLFGHFYDRDSLRPTTRRLTPRQDDFLNSSSRLVSLEFVWHQLEVTIRFEMFTECFTISSFVELDSTRQKLASGRSVSDIGDLNGCVGRILDYLHASAAPPSSPGTNSRDLETEAQAISQYCFHSFWKLFDQEVFSLGGLGADTAGLLDGVFADFRGIIASDQAVAFDDDEFFGGERPPSWGARAKSTFLPLIQHRDAAQHTRYECAINYLLDGRALYMSTLGPQRPTQREDERIPVEFIVYARQRFHKTTVVNKWQLGRLVSQILQLGTLRLCALKNIRELHVAGEALAGLDSDSQAARDAIAPKRNGQHDALDGEADQIIPPDIDNAMRLVEQVHLKLNGITRRFLRETGSGLAYRIERSRYYVQQFEENVKLLRIKRIEGDQPYDQFIRRRLGPQFDFIDRLGRRYERATRNVVTLDQNYLAISQNRLAETNAGIQHNIRVIQEWGELALLAVLLPYYTMHLVVMMIPEHHPIVAPLTLLCWSIFGMIAVNRKFSRTAAGFHYSLFMTVLKLIALCACLGAIHVGLTGRGLFGGYHVTLHDIMHRLDDIDAAEPDDTPNATPSQPEAGSAPQAQPQPDSGAHDAVGPDGAKP